MCESDKIDVGVKNMKASNNDRLSDSTEMKNYVDSRVL